MFRKVSIDFFTILLLPEFCSKITNLTSTIGMLQVSIGRLLLINRFKAICYDKWISFSALI